MLPDFSAPATLHRDDETLLGGLSFALGRFVRILTNPNRFPPTERTRYSIKVGDRHYHYAEIESLGVKMPKEKVSAERLRGIALADIMRHRCFSPNMKFIPCQTTEDGDWVIAAARDAPADLVKHVRDVER